MGPRITKSLAYDSFLNGENQPVEVSRNSLVRSMRTSSDGHGPSCGGLLARKTS